jgi:hypothetical protein
MIVSLPNIRESSGHVVRGFIAKFYTREDSRFAEEGVGVKSEPQENEEYHEGEGEEADKADKA